MLKSNCGLFINLIPWSPFVSLIVALGLLVFTGLYLRKNVKVLSLMGVSSLLIGGLGNMAQRYQTGCVVDFLNFFGLFYYNVFDLFVDAGLTLLLIDIWKKK